MIEGRTVLLYACTGVDNAAWLAALIANMVIESAVQVLHLGALTFLLPIPFVIRYGVGFAVGAVANRPGGLTGPEKLP